MSSRKRAMTAAKFRRILEASGMTQEEFGSQPEVDVTRRTVIRWSQGGSTIHRKAARDILLLAQRLGIPTE